MSAENDLRMAECDVRAALYCIASTPPVRPGDPVSAVVLAREINRVTALARRTLAARERASLALRRERGEATEIDVRRLAEIEQLAEAC